MSILAELIASLKPLLPLETGVFKESKSQWGRSLLLLQLRLAMIYSGVMVVPRMAREESGTGYYHIMMRGINRESIYRTLKDKEYFMKLLQEGERLSLVAYCLMDNHAHLVLKANISDLADAIRKINVKYAMHYNFSHSRLGHVFQNRYRSEVVDTEEYLLQVIRYVHNNPVKAGMAKDLGKLAFQAVLSGEG